MKKWLLLVGLVLLVLSLAGCAVGSYSSSEDQTQAVVEEQQQRYVQNQPVPMFDWSQDRDTLIQIYKLKNEARETYTIFTGNNGAPVYECPSRGYALAADTQLTNPDQVVYAGYQTYEVIEQPEPNGLFSSKNTVGTWVLCVIPSGEIVPIYTELNVTTLPFAVVRQEDGTYKMAEGAAPSAVIDIKP